MGFETQGPKVEEKVEKKEKRKPNFETKGFGLNEQYERWLICLVVGVENQKTNKKRNFQGKKV